MARIRFAGHEYTATPVRLLDNGKWRMVVHQEGPRFIAGGEIDVPVSDVIEISAADVLDAAATVVDMAIMGHRRAKPDGDPT